MLPIIASAMLFAAANVYLWSFPISPTSLFLVTTPAAILYFAWLIRMVMRT
jgi:hypothetical protein